MYILPSPSENTEILANQKYPANIIDVINTIYFFTLNSLQA